jgi:hypothetical protein
MDFDSLNEIQHNEAVRKRLAKLVAHDCFRNTKLEDFHSGKYPSSKTGDYSDVKVVSPRARGNAGAFGGRLSAKGNLGLSVPARTEQLLEKGTRPRLFHKYL